MRAFAVRLVFITHLADWIGLASPLIKWMAQAGVLAFFVHTSLVLMSSLERDGARNRPHWMSRFYVRGAFRIYPLAWVVIALVVALVVPAGGLSAHYDPMTLRRVLANVALAQNLAGQRDVLGPIWTTLCPATSRPLKLRVSGVPVQGHEHSAHGGPRGASAGRA